MSRLPRRPSRVKPPLRGRAATQHYRGEFAPVASVRRPLNIYGSRLLSPPHQERKPPIPAPDSPIPRPPSQSELYADLAEFYKRLGRLLRRIDQPWQWLLLASAIVLSSLLLLS
ncbi:hypothetical protein IQ260_08525 [Leptolyngbya cf. ectocarpi LEGE 11479]|uniref:Uncharacterized protein n=1 Tax=Leptolyngbya cf. ectocarpi LEGE 11479 TaxID=1828722 RepID=A0A928X2Q3_LEPEC|nr:hypothetical protein [Leptolyngbya ectocarpi]MBE9066696.1 hypothetical protein [Leptolyngbya cf. ectocarpi LEGE 11479]